MRSEVKPGRSKVDGKVTTAVGGGGDLRRLAAGLPPPDANRHGHRRARGGAVDGTGYQVAEYVHLPSDGHRRDAGLERTVDIDRRSAGAGPIDRLPVGPPDWGPKEPGPVGLGRAVARAACGKGYGHQVAGVHVPPDAVVLGADDKVAPRQRGGWALQTG